ncbi:MAG: magnesium transporter [Nitrospinae bacterium CG22_combo_CG10-13_8_21_14_all_47_10]|nr:MAG: magnesium transporter [Nitrospinae bacterium CG22_combo_CG10-13_8_21_14_all_47_10]
MPIEKIKEAFKESTIEEPSLPALIASLDHFDVARRLHELNRDQKVQVFHLLENDKKRQELLYETDLDSRLEIQKSLDQDYLAALLDDMPEDEATDIIQELPDEIQEELLSKMETRDAQVIKDLIHYEEETAGGLMNPDFNKFRIDDRAGDIFTEIRRDSKKETIPYFYVVNERDQLMGFFKLRDLLNVQTSAIAKEFIRPETPKVNLEDPCEKVAQIMGQEHLSSLPVVNKDNVIMGIITFDDVIRAMQDSASEDIYTMVGTATIDPFAKKIRHKIIARAPWLFTTFVGGLLSAWILGLYQTTLAEFAAVIFFIPFVIGLAGNVGIQGATVIVRGLATGDIQKENLSPVVKSELSVGILNGLIFGLMCGGLVYLVSEPLLHTNPVLGLVVGLGIILAVSVASLMGSLTPILLINLDIDPAISTGPMITVINDILGLAIYLTTATYFFTML